MNTSWRLRSVIKTKKVTEKKVAKENEKGKEGKSVIKKFVIITLIIRNPQKPISICGTFPNQTNGLDHSPSSNPFVTDENQIPLASCRPFRNQPTVSIHPVLLQLLLFLLRRYSILMALPWISISLSLSLLLLYVATIIRHSFNHRILDLFFFSLSSPYSFSLFSLFIPLAPVSFSTSIIALSPFFPGLLFSFLVYFLRCLFIIMSLFCDNSSFMILDCLFQDGRSLLDLRMWFRCHLGLAMWRERDWLISFRFFGNVFSLSLLWFLFGVKCEEMSISECDCKM